MFERVRQYIWSYDPCDHDAPRSDWRLFLQIIALVVRDLLGGMITLRAMGLVYTTLLSLVPLLAVSISVLKGFGVHDQLEPTLVRLLAPIGEKSVEISARIVGFVENMRIGVLGAVGLVLLIFTVVSLIQKIETAFNYTWRLQGGRSLIRRFSNYLSVIMVGPVLVFSAVGITVTLSSNYIVEMLQALPYMNDLTHLLGKFLPFVLVIGAFTFIYLLVPNTRVQIKSALYGAVVAGVLWQICGILFASFVGGSTSYTAIYSGLAILLVFMIWLYLSWVILLIGSSIAFYHQHPERLKWRNQNLYLSARLREQLTLQVMVDIARAHDRRIDLVPTLENLAAYQQVPADVLQRLLNTLEADGLLQQSADEPPRYLPGTTLQRIRLIDIWNSARAAEEGERAERFRTDAPVAGLLRDLDQGLQIRLGDTTLVEFLQRFDSESEHENSLV